MGDVNVFVNSLREFGLGETLPERLKRLRKAAGLTQLELATAVGVAVGTVNKWEQGKQGLRGDNLTAVAKALRVRVEDLSEPTENVSRGTVGETPANLTASVVHLLATDPERVRELVDLLMDPKIRALWDKEAV